MNWPKQDVEYVREEIGHREYGDALENLIALGLKNAEGSRPTQVRRIEAIAATMGMQASHLVVQLQTVSGHAAA